MTNLPKKKYLKKMLQENVGNRNANNFSSRDCQIN